MSATQPRRFVSLSRTPLGTSGFAFVLDAIDEDGRAWWLIRGLDTVPGEWTELRPLPSREDRP